MSSAGILPGDVRIDHETQIFLDPHAVLLVIHICTSMSDVWGPGAGVLLVLIVTSKKGATFPSRLMATLT